MRKVDIEINVSDEVALLCKIVSTVELPDILDQATDNRAGREAIILWAKSLLHDE